MIFVDSNRLPIVLIFNMESQKFLKGEHGVSEKHTMVPNNLDFLSDLVSVRSPVPKVYEKKLEILPTIVSMFISE